MLENNKMVSNDDLEAIAGGMCKVTALKVQSIMLIIPGIISGIHQIPKKVRDAMTTAFNSAQAGISELISSEAGEEISNIDFAVQIANAVCDGVEKGIDEDYKCWVNVARGAIQLAVLFKL